jgi:hypothetical protein
MYPLCIPPVHRPYFGYNPRNAIRGYRPVNDGRKMKGGKTMSEKESVELVQQSFAVLRKGDMQALFSSLTAVSQYGWFPFVIRIDRSVSGDAA